MEWSVLEHEPLEWEAGDWTSEAWHSKCFEITLCDIGKGSDFTTEFSFNITTKQYDVTIDINNKLYFKNSSSKSIKKGK